MSLCLYVVIKFPGGQAGKLDTGHFFQSGTVLNAARRIGHSGGRLFFAGDTKSFESGFLPHSPTSS
jgi:hypothetical protein